METVSVKLPESLKISEIEDVKELLNEHISAEQSICFDASDVAAIDYSGVQLLLILCQEISSKGLTVSWENVSKPLKEAAGYLDANAYLGIN